VSTRLDFFVYLKHESSTIMSFVCIRYSMRNPLSDRNMPDPQSSAVRQLR